MRLDFLFEGKRRRPVLMTNGRPMAPTPANIRWAERFSNDVKEMIRLGTFSYAEHFPSGDDATTGVELTLGRQLDTWLSTQRIEHSTRAGYTSAIKFWKGSAVDGGLLGDRPVRGLKHSHFLLALGARASLSGKTINNYVSVLREALQLAVTDGTLKDNPAAKIPRASWQREPPDPFSMQEAEAIIADMRTHCPEAVANMVEWRFYSGVRTSEMAGLRWGSIDFNSGYQRIHEAIVRGVDKAKTKTGVSRDVRLNSRSLAALQRQAKHTKLAGEHVWLDPRYGTAWLEERAFRRSYWTPCLKRLGIRYRAPNHCRHTFATMMLMAGRTAAWCAGQMGHSVEIFHSTYARWVKGDQDDREVAGLEAWIAASTKVNDADKSNASKSCTSAGQAASPIRRQL
jgi:integrase